MLPFVVAHNGAEDCLYWEKLINPEMQWYHDILELENDKRLRRIGRLTDALREKVIAFAVMGPRKMCNRCMMGWQSDIRG